MSRLTDYHPNQPIAYTWDYKPEDIDPDLRGATLVRDGVTMSWWITGPEVNIKIPESEIYKIHCATTDMEAGPLARMIFNRYKQKRMRFLSAARGGYDG